MSFSLLKLLPAMLPYIKISEMSEEKFTKLYNTYKSDLDQIFSYEIAISFFRQLKVNASLIDQMSEQNKILYFTEQLEQKLAQQTNYKEHQQQK